MKAKNIVITEADYGRLQRLMNRLGIVVVSTLRTLTHLSKNWRRSTIMPATDVPDDVVTTNSRVPVKDLNSRREFTYRIAFPWNCTDQRAVTGDLA